MSSPEMTAQHGLAVMQAVNVALEAAIGGDNTALHRAQLLVQVLGNIMQQAAGL